MTISFEGAALCIAITLLVAIASTLIVMSVVREWNRQRIKKEDKDQELLGAIQSVHSAMQVVATRMQDKSEMDRDHHSRVLTEVHELGTLVLDVEKHSRSTVRKLGRSSWIASIHIRGRQSK